MPDGRSPPSNWCSKQKGRPFREERPLVESNAGSKRTHMETLDDALIGQSIRSNNRHNNRGEQKPEHKPPGRRNMGRRSTERTNAGHRTAAVRKRPVDRRAGSRTAGRQADKRAGSMTWHKDHSNRHSFEPQKAGQKEVNGRDDGKDRHRAHSNRHLERPGCLRIRLFPSR